MDRAYPRAKVPYTYKEYVYLPDDGKRYEILDGDLYVSPAPNTAHQTILGRLMHFLMSQLEDSRYRGRDPVTPRSGA